MQEIYLGVMDFAGYQVTAAGTSKTQVKDAIKKSVMDSVYGQEGVWAGRSWASAWSYFGGHVERVSFGKAEWR